MSLPWLSRSPILSKVLSKIDLGKAFGARLTEVAEELPPNALPLQRLLNFEF